MSAAHKQISELQEKPFFRILNVISTFGGTNDDTEC